MKYRRGWFGENYRHYLASKGVPTNRYFVRNDLKGNRGSSLLHSLYARGYSNPEIAQSPNVPTPVRNEAYAKLRSRRQTQINVPELQGGDAPTTSPAAPFVPSLAESASFTPLEQQQVPVVEGPPAPATPAEPSIADVDAASGQEGIAPIESEGFEEPTTLSSLNLPESPSQEAETKTAPTTTPGVPELPSYGMVTQ